MSDREQEIIAAYEQWSPDEEPISELVERLSISRQRLYGVLEKNQIIPKSRRARGAMGMVDAPLMQEMAEMALGYLLNQLQEARDELMRYREAYGPL